jgi:hypothetical protein
MLGKARLSVLVAVLGALSFGPGAQADVPSALGEDAGALNAMAQTWPVLQSAAQSYGQLAPYAAATWAGPGPRKQTLYGYWEQCHNTRWDSVIQNLVTGGLNIAGDAQARFSKKRDALNLPSPTIWDNCVPLFRKPEITSSIGRARNTRARWSPLVALRNPSPKRTGGPSPTTWLP